jgi:hypothetical protein
MPELEGVALPLLTKQTFPEWPLPPLKRQDFTHKNGLAMKNLTAKQNQNKTFWPKS